MFIGRQQELQLLRQELACDQRAILVYGKRRVGKTTLIKKAIADANCKAVYFECVKGTMQENIDSFVQELMRVEILPVVLSFTSFADVFAYLNTLPRSFVIVIDEYPYLKSMSDSDAVDSLFQNIIDNKLKNIRLILSGSHIGMMKDMLREGNALYGRFHAVIRLVELNYLDASGFYPDRSAYDKVAFYSVFGGSPFINEALNANETLRENIIRTILNPNNPVYLYASQLLLSDYSIRMNAERIFAVLGNGRKRYSDIENRLDANKTGALSKQIKSLMDLEIIHRNEPINKPGDNKKFTFEINDNLLRFFFTFVYRSGSALQMLGADAFYEQYVEPELTQFVSRRFEGICRDCFSLMVRSGKMKNVRNIGSYYYDDPRNRKNGEFDVALEHADGYSIIEAKYFIKPMEMDEIHREIGQIREINELDVKQIGFVSVNGFAAKEDGCLYYTGEDLYDL
ncbi:MAG: ATP-binding protein [Clostridia bacterium]|nr:ATP-binding protein [Clostridia bacterium]